MTTSEAYTTLLALSRASQPYSALEESKINEIYTAVTGKKMRDCNCRDKWHDAIVEALIYIKNNGKMREKCDYTLRAGVILHVGSRVYTNANLTNEVAEQFLKDNPNAVGRFAVVPHIKAEKPKRKGK